MAEGGMVCEEPEPLDLAPRQLISKIGTTLEGALSGDWDGIEGHQLLADVEALVRLSDRFDALRAKAMAALDRSGVWAELESRSTAGLLAKRTPQRCPRQARADLRHGTRLRRLPHTRAAFEAGQVTAEHVRVLGECLHRRFMGRLADFEEQLVDLASELSWQDWVRVVNLWKDNADAIDPQLADEADLAAREVFLSSGFGNRGVLGGTLTPYARQVVRSELDRLTDVLFRDDWSAAVERLGEGNVSSTDLGRTPGQRRHDALLLMAERSASAGDADQPAAVMVYVHCTKAEFDASLDQSAGLHPDPVDVGRAMREYDDGTPISRRMLARLALRAQIARVVFGPASRVLDLGVPRRFFSAAQREAIAIRDRRCVCGCGLPARSCEADHVIEFRDGGRTVVANGQSMCHASHRYKTLNRSRYGPPPLGASPLGREPPQRSPEIAGQPLQGVVEVEQAAGVALHAQVPDGEQVRGE